MTKLWTIPPLWPGKTVAVLASGPSMSQKVADSVRQLPCIAINSTYLLAPWADMLFAHDLHWWQANPKAEQFAGLRVCGQAGEIDAYQVRLPRDTVVMGPGHEVDIRNSGLDAVWLAAEAGAAKVLLYGFDLVPGHWHPEHVGLGQTAPGTYAILAAGLAQLSDRLRARGVEVERITEMKEEVIDERRQGGPLPAGEQRAAGRGRAGSQNSARRDPAGDSPPRDRDLARIDRATQDR